MSPSLSKPSISAVKDPAYQTSLFSLLFTGVLGLWLLAAPSVFCTYPPTDNNYWPSALGILGLAVVALFGALDREAKYRVDTIGLGLLLFCGWNLVATFLGVYKDDAWLEMARMTGGLFLYFALRAFPQRIPAITLCAIAGALVPAATTIIAFVSSRNAQQQAGFLNPNMFAALLAPTLMLSLLVPVIVRQRTHSGLATIVGFGPFVVLALALAFTSSKGGFLSALTAICIFIMAAFRARGTALKNGLRRAWPVVLLVVLVFGFVAARTVGKRLAQARSTDENSTQFRVYLWRSTLDMAKARPVVGFGPGSFKTAYPAYAQVGFTRLAHQSWLQIAAEGGWPALAILLVTFALAARMGWRKLRTAHWIEGACGLSALTAIFIHGFFDSGWSVLAVLALVSVALALCHPNEADEQTASQEEIRGLNWPFLGVTVVFLLAGYGTQKTANSEDLLALAEERIQQRQPPTTVPEAVQADEGSARAWNFLGKVTPLENRESWTQAFEKAMQLQPTNGAHPLDLARQIDRLANQSPEDVKKVSELYDQAVALDPLNSSYRVERAKWRLEHKDSRGYDDLEFVLREWDQPYGKYPAIGRDMDINLDFARATLAIAPHLKATGQTSRLQSLAKRALEDCAVARNIQKTRAEFLKAMNGRSSIGNFRDLDSLESGLNSLV